MKNLGNIVVPLVFMILASLSPCVQCSSSENLPYLYLGRFSSQCKADSPEFFYWEVAEPSLANLNEEIHGFFGILMDKLEESLEEEEEELEKKWMYIMETIQASLENTFDRIKEMWSLIVVVLNTPPLPWEQGLQLLIAKDLLDNVEYQYVMLGAVIKSGAKEVIGTLQNKISHAIKEMEKHVRELASEGESVDELKLLKRMEQSLQKMKSDFISKLLRRIVKNAIGSGKSNNNVKVFFSKMMEESAIVFQAYRQKGHVFPKFWTEIAHIMKLEMESRDIASFLHHFKTNSELFVENVFAILISSIPKL